MGEDLPLVLSRKRDGSRCLPARNTHGISAGLMFLILAYFCYAFFNRAKAKDYPQAKVPAAIHALRGTSIILSIITVRYDGLTGNSLN